MDGQIGFLSSLVKNIFKIIFALTFSHLDKLLMIISAQAIKNKITTSRNHSEINTFRAFEFLVQHSFYELYF